MDAEALAAYGGRAFMHWVLEPGTVLGGKYQIERVLGRGGMGVVAAARHLELEDRVAIKFLLPEMLNAPEVVARFLTEARAARKLRTEHAAKVSDVGTLPETGAPYMVMELLEGQDLAAVVANGPLPLNVAVEYVLQACVAIAEAHSLGIIHRDLKPANLFLTHRPDGSACIKVLDFGIAKVSGSGSNPALTRTSAMLGTVLYAAPEQLQSAKLVDARCDVWSLGVTLYQLVSGRFPFDGQELPMVIAQVLSMPHTPLTDYLPGLPPAFVAVVERCLQKTREARFQNVAELASALAAWGGVDGARYEATVHRILAGTASVDAARSNDAPLVAAAPQAPRAATTAGSLGSAAITHSTPPRASASALRWILPLLLAGAAATAWIARQQLASNTALPASSATASLPIAEKAPVTAAAPVSAAAPVNAGNAGNAAAGNAGAPVNAGVAPEVAPSAAATPVAPSTEPATSAGPRPVAPAVVVRNTGRAHRTVPSQLAPEPAPVKPAKTPSPNPASTPTADDPFGYRRAVESP